jgi:hypothetical protein
MRSAIAFAGLVLAAAVLPASAAPTGAQRGVDTHSDFGVTLVGPDSTSVGGRATYEMQISNAGPDPSKVKLRFNRGRGASAADFDGGKSVRTVSQTASKGECKPDSRGVICRPGEIAPGETVDVEVVMKVLDSYLPKLAVQATVSPEVFTEFDTNQDNDHVEVATPVREPISVEGVPDNCATRPFKLVVKTDVPTAKRTKVIVDGKVLDTSAGPKLTVTVKPVDLDKGSHRLSIVVQGGGGPPLATLERRFKTC